MGRKKGVPGYCLHKSSGLAYVTIDGKEEYLGKYGSPGSRRRYAELIARLEAGAEAQPPPDLTVRELVARYDAFARDYYVKGGRPTRQYERVKRSLAVALLLFGSTPAAAFGPLALDAVRDAMIERGWSRRHVNACAGCVRRAWRWAASRQIVPPSSFEALRTLDGLRQGRTHARETAPRGPVADGVIGATLARLQPEVADMVRLQRLTAMRAGEVCMLRGEEIDRSGAVWTWSPADHKTAHLGRGRLVLFGPRAQALLAPLLAARPEGYVFSPRRMMERIREESRASGRPPRACRETAPSRPPGECWTSNSYQRAIRRACDAAGVPPWSSHQLRHAAAAALRAAFGVEAVAGVLGHSRVETAQLYAPRNLAAAVDAVLRAG